MVFTVLVSFCNIYCLAIYFSFSLLQSRRAAELPICLPFCDSSCRLPVGVGGSCGVGGRNVANDTKQRLCQLCHLSSCCPNWSSLKTHQSTKSMRRILIDGAATRGVGKGRGGGVGGTLLQAVVSAACVSCTCAEVSGLITTNHWHHYHYPHRRHYHNH